MKFSYDFTGCRAVPGVIVYHNNMPAKILECIGPASASNPLSHYSIKIMYLETNDVVTIPVNHIDYDIKS